ncbi:TANK-binding kinase 1-binding protein 1 [Channa argus]|uniref:TANK-binding kinase 1-binding protein 1 n=1 Tax=Channa argus TaxID=215402 RepID=A0A6G1QAJ9_CHAAH|nr:TANK-binding kinase 1-binding protein 1 [Channa argus]
MQMIGKASYLMMDLFGRAELGLLGGGEGLRDDVGIPGISWSANRLPDDVYPTSGLALAAAYHDIKTRLASLERENSSIKRKLKHYEFPMISEFGEERILCCSYEPIMKDTSVIQSETTNMQQRINSLTQETTLAEQHVERIHSLEAALRQRETSLQKLSAQLRSKDGHQSQLHASLDVPREGRGPMLQSSRSLDALSDLKLQQLEAELEGARHQAEGACQREKELRAELQRLQQEVAQLQEAQTQSQELSLHCEHCDVEWIKKAGDEQVNLALAYTELTEELGRVRSLAAKQSDLLRHVSQDPVSRPNPAPQLLSPTSPQRPSLSPDRLLPSPSPPLSPVDGPASYSHQPTSSRLRAKFQGRRSYSEVSDPSAIQRPPARLMRDPVSTLPKPRSILSETQGYSKTKSHLLGLVRPASAHGAGGERRVGGGGAERGGGSSLSSSPHHCALDLGFPMVAEVHHFCRLDDPLEPTPLVTPPQSSDDEELWMESEESATRSCPLCQLTFPTGYPDDALIKHIDSHLENSKI